MSYDMWIEADGDSEEFNYTYNVSGMWYAANPDKGIRAHYGKTGREAIEPLYQIAQYMATHPELREMEPSNGWEVIRALLPLSTSSLKRASAIQIQSGAAINQGEPDMEIQVKPSFIFMVGSQFVALDSASGGYPYLTDRWTSVETFPSRDEAYKYKNIFRSNPSLAENDKWTLKEVVALKVNAG